MGPLSERAEAAALLAREMSGTVETNVPLRTLTTFGIGGPAAILAIPADVKDVQLVIRVCTETGTPLYVMGAGSNVIVPDEGVDGVVLRLSAATPACAGFSEPSVTAGAAASNPTARALLAERKGQGLTHLAWCDGTIVAGAGVSDARLAELALDRSVTGFEWIYDIPGSVGGAVFMNAGNDEGDMKGNLVSARFINRAGQLVERCVGDLGMDYRSTRFQHEPWLIVEAVLSANRTADKDTIRRKMNAIRNKRRSKFPEQTLCAGSIFKRPKGSFAGKLIEEAGLGGTRIGGAMVSNKHKGFIVNMGDATAKDVLSLISLVRSRVFETSQIELEPEVELLTAKRFC